MVGIGTTTRYANDVVPAAAFAAMMYPHQREYVEQCDVTAGSGVLEVDVGPGTVWAAGGMDEVTGATLTLPVNTSGQPRIDFITVFLDYTARVSTLASVTGQPGASPDPPVGGLSRSRGVAWHVPLAAVRVNSGQGVLSSGQIQDVRPGPWIAMDLLSPWFAYGGGYEVPQRRLTPDGTVELRGLVRTNDNLTSPVVQPIARLPYMWRPATQLIFPAPNSHTSAGTPYATTERIDVTYDGLVRPAYPENTVASAHWYSLTAIRFTP